MPPKKAFERSKAACTNQRNQSVRGNPYAVNPYRRIDGTRKTSQSESSTGGVRNAGKSTLTSAPNGVPHSFQPARIRTTVQTGPIPVVRGVKRGINEVLSKEEALTQKGHLKKRKHHQDHIKTHLDTLSTTALASLGLLMSRINYGPDRTFRLIITDKDDEENQEILMFDSTKEVIPEEVKKHKMEISAKYWYPGLRRTEWNLDSDKFWKEFFQEMSTVKLGWKIYERMPLRWGSTNLVSLEMIINTRTLIVSDSLLGTGIENGFLTASCTQVVLPGADTKQITRAAFHLARSCGDRLKRVVLVCETNDLLNYVNEVQNMSKKGTLKATKASMAASALMQITAADGTKLNTYWVPPMREITMRSGDQAKIDALGFRRQLID